MVEDFWTKYEGSCGLMQANSFATTSRGSGNSSCRMGKGSKGSSKGTTSTDKERSSTSSGRSTRVGGTTTSSRRGFPSADSDNYLYGNDT